MEAGQVNLDKEREKGITITILIQGEEGERKKEEEGGEGEEGGGEEEEEVVGEEKGRNG